MGALRSLARDVDTTPLERVSGAKPEATGHRVTSGDVNRMMQVMAEQKPA